MVDISDRLEQIKKMIDAGQYFTINRARQYGKTTALCALAKYLEQEVLRKVSGEEKCLDKSRIS